MAKKELHTLSRSALERVARTVRAYERDGGDRGGKRRRRRVREPDEVVVIRIVDNRTRGGCYKVIICRNLMDGAGAGYFDTTATAQVHGALFAAVEGTEEEATGVNLNEHGGSPVTHKLTHVSNTFQLYFVGLVHPALDDAGRRVVVFNGHWTKAC